MKWWSVVVVDEMHLKENVVAEWGRWRIKWAGVGEWCGTIGGMGEALGG